MTTRRKILVSFACLASLVVGFFLAPFPLTAYIARDGAASPLASKVFNLLYSPWIARQTNPYGRLFVSHMNELCREHPDFCKP
jgi:hypothetical protein